MILMSLVLINTGCEEQIAPTNIPSEGGKMVEVSLNIGFADEVDGATLSATPTMKSNQVSGRQAAFDVQLLPATQTKAVSNYPDKLYNLEIYQYTATGTHLASITNIGSIDPGAAITSTLSYNDGNECQLLIIARGATQAVASLSGKSLSEVREITANAATIKNINATDETNTGINNMPYLLYLPKVKIAGGKLTSPEGTDVRLLLKRLAVGLTINWTFNVSGYTLSEVRLMQVPKDYRILPVTEEIVPYGTMYPTSVSEFVDGFRLKGATLTSAGGNKGSQTLWIPANARGTRSDVTYPTYRNKNYAHSAATYVEFVVDGKEQRLLYRAYLGGNTTSDFNLLENTNYNWTINLNNANYTSDPRIQLLDLTPVVSSNLQTTANCFMMKPGTNICFNPYKHEAGTDGWNTYLASGGTISKTIDKVKVLWQTKDAGTNGELVMGYVAASDNHSNLVNFTGTTVGDARIHIKVPNTNGGNAVIAAYNSSNKIVWSWHLWISDYVPVRLDVATINDDDSRKKAISKAQAATVNGIVHTYQGNSWVTSQGAFYKKVIMDRDLGAIRSMRSTTGKLDAARTFGMLYQWGRKDPMFGSADGTSNEIDIIFDGEGVSTGVARSSGISTDNTIANPSTFYTSGNLPNNSWGPETKTIYDPCPQGWRVPDFYDEYADKQDINHFMFDGFVTGKADDRTRTFNNNYTLINMRVLNGGVWYNNPQSTMDDVTNGFIYFYPGESESNYTNLSAWFPSYRKRESSTGNFRDPNTASGFKPGLLPSYCMSSAHAYNSGMAYYTEFKSNALFLADPTSSGKTYGLTVRCIQDN
ncbi:DUF4906 domain-containing protein [Parabacteroides sp.]